MDIHKTAVVAPTARLGEKVIVGPYSVIGPHVTIDDHVVIGPHCVIEGRTHIGAFCRIFSGAVIGSPPQDKKHREDDDVHLIIGERNVFREYVTVNPGTRDGGGRTVIGDDNLFMAYAHIAHDCRIGHHCVMANAATLAGHVTVEDHAVVGGLSAVHQFVRLGRLSIIGGCSKVVQDVPPFSLCDGHPARIYGLNLVGLKRHGYDVDRRRVLKKAFRILFQEGRRVNHAIESLSRDVASSGDVRHLIEFVQASQRGLCSPIRRDRSAEPSTSFSSHKPE